MAAVANFVKRDDRYKTEKPYLYHGPEQEGFPHSNVIYEESPLSLTDLRHVPDFKPTMESHGFCFIENKSKELPTLVDESNSQPYAVEMAGVLKKLLNATLVLPVQTRVCFFFLFFFSNPFSSVAALNSVNSMPSSSNCSCVE